MKPEHSTDPTLTRLLRDDKTDAALPPRFQEQVWERISRAEMPAANPLLLLRAWVAQAFTRTSFAVGYATLLLLLGLFAGFWQAHASSARTTQALSSRYVQMMDPYQMPRP